VRERLRHPRDAHAARDEVDDGLHLDRLLRDPHGLAARVVGGDQRVVQRRRDLAREDHQRLGADGAPAQARHRPGAVRRRRPGGVALRQGHHQRLVDHAHVFEARRGGAGRMQHEAGVDLAGGEQLQLHVQRRLAQAQGDVRIGRAKAAEPGRQRPVGDAGDEGQAQLPRQARRRRAHRRRERVGAVQQLARQRQQGLAGGAQRDAALRALEQARAQRRLQALDGLGQRRLRHRQARGGAAEVALLGEDGELAQLPQVERGVVH